MDSALSKLAGSDGVHAILVYGTEGAFPERHAAEVAKTWLCENPSPSGACGVCGSCGSYERGTHPDLQVYRPNEGSNQILIGQIREQPPKAREVIVNVPLLNFVRTPPLKSKYKVANLESVDRLHPRAANALLKTLEEPSPYVRFILSTRAVSRVLTTIRSRCVTVKLNSEMPSADSDMLSMILNEVPHLAEPIRKDEAASQNFRDLMADIGTKPIGAALRLSEDFRKVSAIFQQGDTGASKALAQSLELLAAGVATSFPERPDRVAAVVEAHRRAQGNAQANLLLDDLFVKLLQ